MPRLKETLRDYTARLTKSDVDSPRLSAEVLLAFAMDVPRSELLKELIIRPETELTDSIVARAETLMVRREAGEPAAYIIGVKEFYGRDFTVTHTTLIPRPDTETLIDAALEFAVPYAAATPKFMDMGTGSGAIAVTLALELPTWQGIAVDISPEALSVAKVNAHTLGATNVCFLQEDFLSPELPRGPYDVIVANPPYISEKEYAELSREVAGFEPKSALVPNVPQASGLECLFAIMDKTTEFLCPGGLLLMEMGHAQGDALLCHAAISEQTWENVRILPDMAGFPRIFHAVRTEHANKTERINRLL